MVVVVVPAKKYLEPPQVKANAGTSGAGGDIVVPGVLIEPDPQNTSKNAAIVHRLLQIIHP